MARLVVFALALALAAPEARAASTAHEDASTAREDASTAREDASTALRVAEAAFEYRDFERVIEILDPWVHPPRIADAAAMLEARKLLGVAHHVTGNITAAREEFAQILLAEPEYQLDPFVIPPQVIETFEALRREMRPVLERALRQRGKTPRFADGSTGRVILLPSRWVTVLPAGIPQFATGEPGWGAVFASLQAASLAANIAGFFIADGARPGESGYDAGRAMQYVGLGALATSYATSVVLGNISFDAYTERLLSAGPTAAAAAPVPTLRFAATFAF